MYSSTLIRRYTNGCKFGKLSIADLFRNAFSNTLFIHFIIDFQSIVDGDLYRLTLLDKVFILKKGYGVDIIDPEVAAMHFHNVDAFWNNEHKNPFIQYMISFYKDTASTPEEAMRLTREIMEPITKEHLALCVVHRDERSDAMYHSHTYVGATNFHNGSMMYSDNKTNYAMAQRTADVTGRSAKLVVDYGKDKQWECKKVFVPAEVDE